MILGPALFARKIPIFFFNVTFLSSFWKRKLIFELEKNLAKEVFFYPAKKGRCGVLIALTNSVEFRHAKDVKTLELRVMN